MHSGRLAVCTPYYRDPSLRPAAPLPPDRQSVHTRRPLRWARSRTRPSPSCAHLAGPRASQVIGVVDTDTAADKIDYPIIANTRSLRFYHTFAHMIVRAVNEGVTLREELDTYELVGARIVVPSHPGPSFSRMHAPSRRSHVHTRF